MIIFPAIDLKDNKCVRLEKGKKEIEHCKPILKESYFYRKVFEKFYPGKAYVIPHFWMPKWTNTNDPSARELENYKE